MAFKNYKEKLKLNKIEDVPISYQSCYLRCSIWTVNYKLSICVARSFGE